MLTALVVVTPSTAVRAMLQEVLTLALVLVLVLLLALAQVQVQVLALARVLVLVLVQMLVLVLVLVLKMALLLQVLVTLAVQLLSRSASFRCPPKTLYVVSLIVSSATSCSRLQPWSSVPSTSRWDRCVLVASSTPRASIDSWGDRRTERSGSQTSSWRGRTYSTSP
jgi:hypothetical protein